MRRIPLLTGLLLAVLAAGAIVAGPASAEYRHPTAMAEFGPDGTSATSFVTVNTLAYQQSTHRLFVLDAGSGIHGFNHPSPGTFTPLGGSFPIAHSSVGLDSDLAVDNTSGSTAGDLYLSPDGPTISSYDASGAALATPYNGGSEICGVAVDNAGNIWAGRYGGNDAAEFTPGSPTVVETVSASTGATSPCKIAIDPSNNDLYLSRWGENGVWQYTAASDYATAKRIGGDELGNNNRVTVNGAKHVVYIGGPNSGGKIRAFDTTSGDLLETIEPPGGAIRGLAVEEATDTLFVATGTGNKVLEMPGLPTPKATTDAPGETAAVSGTADPAGDGPITECYFEFGPTTSYGSRQNCAQSLPIGAAEPVTATLPVGSESTSHYRLVVANATPGAVGRGTDRTLVLHNVKAIQTEAASQIYRSTAQLNASFQGTNEATTYYFEYGTTSSYSSRFPVAPNEETAPPSSGHVTIAVPVSGLTADTSYHFRVVAKNSHGSSLGNDVEFRTRPAVGLVQAEPPTEVTKTTATLRGSYDGATNDTPPGPLESFHYYFEWGQTSSYGNTTATPPGLDGGARAEKVQVSAPIAGLEPFLEDSQPYHFRLVVSNSFGTTFGPDLTFKTQSPDPPHESNVRAEGITPTSAAVAADVDPGVFLTTFVFEYGTEPTYGITTPARTIAALSGNSPVSAALDHLEPGTVYHYRIVATSFSGSTASPGQTFTTPDLPVVESSDPSVSTTTAHLTVAVIANASPTEVHFEYGGSASYGAATASTDAGSGLESKIVGVDLGGLQPGTTYHFRAVATNGIGTTNGPDQTFTTQSAPAASPKSKAKSCKKGFIKHRGKCVKKHKKHKKRAGHRKRHHP